MIRLHLDTIEYEWTEDDKWTNNEGMTFSFASMKKTTTYKGNKKYQNLTVKPEHIEKFKRFLGDIVNNRDSLPPREEDKDTPF
jgi:hypothetical protein